jgi:predicted amidophosphoribosyltransferase
VTRQEVNDDDIESMIVARRKGRKEKSSGFCPKCGKPVTATDRFCPSCGKSLS